MAELHLRIPNALKETIAARAAYADQSINDFVVRMLEASPEPDDVAAARMMEEAVDELWADIDRQEEEANKSHG